MPTLHLGVIDVPYSYSQQQVGRNGKPSRRKKKVVRNSTTGDVAEILEAKYHPMEVFFEEYRQEIAEDLEDSLAGAFESVLTGAPLSINPYGSATSVIEDRFKRFLAEGEIESLGYPGLPTEASGRATRVGGINHRLSRPYAQSNPDRPSLIDTGLYQASFKSWVD